MADPKIHIVYFAYLNTGDKNWNSSHPQKLMIQQLNDIKEYGLADAATSINIIFTNLKKSNFNNAAELQGDRIKETIKNILPSAEIRYNSGNKHEYPGIRRVWDIANDTPQADANNTLILYFHAKGITHNPNSGGERTPINRTLTDTIIKPWREIVARFKRDPAVNKAGYAASDAGIMWFNFWWVRASYAVGCPRPILTENRYYYEEWLGRRKAETPSGAEGFTGTIDCLSLCAGGPDGELGIGMGPGMEKCKTGGKRTRKRRTLKLKRRSRT